MNSWTTSSSDCLPTAAATSNGASSLAGRLKDEARALGFDLVGITRAAEPDGLNAFHAWLQKGHAGEMEYMARHTEARAHPRSVLPQVRSVVMLALNYHARPGSSGPAPRSTSSPLVGRVATYAQGSDYHDVLRERLNRLSAWVQAEVPGCQARGVVDTAPLLERDFARLAGLGWFGKNTMLIHPRLGSFFFLGALLLDIDLPADEPFATNHCGTCTACLDACPTEAFPAPYELDARRCISYLTIELRQPIPADLREGMGDWIFGCDVCQDVCPWNHKAPAGRDPGLHTRGDATVPDLLELLQLTPDGFRERFRGTALTRPKRGGLLRNVAIALGNQRQPRAIPGLGQALEEAEPIVRGAAAWALGQIGGDEARRLLNERWLSESDASVRQEIQDALTALGSGGT